MRNIIKYEYYFSILKYIRLECRNLEYKFVMYSVVSYYCLIYNWSLNEKYYKILEY